VQAASRIAIVLAGFARTAGLTPALHNYIAPGRRSSTR